MVVAICESLWGRTKDTPNKDLSVGHIFLHINFEGCFDLLGAFRKAFWNTASVDLM